VLRARLEDARFFVGEDRKTRLADRLPRLDGVVFQTKLGTVGAKVRRVRALAGHLVGAAIREQVERAADLAKVDLVTSIVGEFPELQGEMGRVYALEQGEDPAVADAIRDHYSPKGAGDSVPVAPISAALALADRADTLVGCFGVGLVPSGSADPYALRRAALGVVRIALEATDVDLAVLLAEARRHYAEQGVKLRDDASGKLAEFFRARLDAFYRERFAPDVVAACLAAWGGGSFRDLDARIAAVAALRARPEFESLATAFKRCHNIGKDAPDGAPSASLYAEDAERALGRAVDDVLPKVAAGASRGEYDAALRLVADDLRAPIDDFFAKVFVMVDDASVRDNRLRLVASVSREVTKIAHLHLLGG
jgi:glycyl-tRNA synthetase beta chain